MGKNLDLAQRRVAASLSVGLLVTLLVGCDLSSAGNEGVNSADGSAVPGAAAVFRGQPPIRIVATTGMIGDIVKNLGASMVEVESLMGEGTDPHLYRASPGDVKKLARSETSMIFYNGLHLEGKMAEVLEHLSKTKPVCAVADGVPRERLRAPPEFKGQYDPHVWFDVSMWMDCVRYVAENLAGFDPERKDHYRSRATAYLARLESLDETVRGLLATIPASQRILVTAHDAFGYLGQAYGVEVVGVQGISTDSEAGVRRVRDLVDLIVERKVKAVFVESSVSEQNIQALVDGARSRGHAVRIGGQLFSDAMGKDGTPEGTYIGMVEHNVRTIVEALK